MKNFFKYNLKEIIIWIYIMSNKIKLKKLMNIILIIILVQKIKKLEKYPQKTFLFLINLQNNISNQMNIKYLIEHTKMKKNQNNVKIKQLIIKIELEIISFN